MTTDTVTERDPLDRFVEERCQCSQGSRVEAGELFAAFDGWCAKEGVGPKSSKSASVRLRLIHGMEREARAGRFFWRGIALKGEQPAGGDAA